MKRNKLLLVVVFACCTNLLSAQTTTESAFATIDDNYCLTISDDIPIQEHYVVDIASFGFENENEAQKAFGMRSNNLITYSVDFANSRVEVHLHFDRLNESKDKAWWNSYLLDTCDRY